MISTQYINLNMVPSGVMPVLHCSQYDVGRPLGVVIYNGSESVDLSGYTVTIEGTRTDRTPVTAGVTTDGNIGVFTTTPTMTNENDTYRAKVVLTDNAGRVSSLAFVMCVDEKTMDENAEEIEEDASLYQQYTGTVQTIIAQIRGDLAAEITARQNAVSAEATARQNAISAEASARQAADNTLQSNINAEASARATEDASLQSQINQLIAPSGSAPSAAEVENARIGSDGTVYPTLGDAIRTQNSLLKSQLEAQGEQITDITGNTPISLVANQYIDLSGTSVTMENGAPKSSGASQLYSYGAVQCTAGDQFTITGTGGSSTRLWGFVTSAGTIISRATSGASATNLVLTAPDTAAWLIIHTNQDKFSYIGKLATLRIADNATEISGIKNRLVADTYIDWRIGNIGSADGINYSSTTRAMTQERIPYNPTHVIRVESGVQFAMRYYGNDGAYVKGSPNWHSSGGSIGEILAQDTKDTANLSAYRIVLRYSNDATVTSAILIGQSFSLLYNGDLETLYNAVNGNTSGIYINQTGKGNCSIRCAKEQSYIDGSHPVIEWYLLEEPGTNRFFYSKDLSEKKYLFTFPYDAYKYSFGVLQNGDIIAVLDADSITTDNKSDANRVNPYVFLASENWTVCHEVNFGSALKPCGWLGNTGYKVIANGDALFCEYTRQTTYTANVWKLSGDPLDPSNWTVTKSFVVTSTDNATLFKHCHMVMQDFYTGVCYMSTGDDLIGAMMWASTDNGSTWTQLVSPDSDGQVNQYGYINGSEKYCRCLTMTFTKDYIYWATDSSSATLHWLFRAERDSNGVMDYSTVVDLVNIPENNGASTYGTAYVQELNAIVLLDRCDVVASEMYVKMVTLDDSQLVTIGKLESASGSRNVGFRTRFSEWYPKNGLIHFGFALHIGRLTNAVNQNKGFNNSGSGDHPENNINNLLMRVYKNGSNFGMVMDTEFI